MNRWQILRGLPPPPPKKVIPIHYYGIDWGPRPESTGIAICHTERDVIIFDHACLLPESNYTCLEYFLYFLNENYPIKCLTVDSPYHNASDTIDDLMCFKYQQKLITPEMVMIFCNAFSNGHIHFSTPALGSKMSPFSTLDVNIRDAMALAFWSRNQFNSLLTPMLPDP